jgi:hypothetical protein
MKQRNNEKKTTNYETHLNLQSSSILRHVFPPSGWQRHSVHQNFTRCISTAKKDAVVCRTESINTELRLQQLEHMIEDKNHQEELRYTGSYLSILT